MTKNKRRYQFPDGSDYPVVESSVGMILPVLDEDVSHADRRNPESCALAQCAMRIGAEKAFIAGTVAYVVLPYKGETVAMRFSINKRTREAIKHFDETGECPAEGFVLSRLEPSARSSKKKTANASRTPEQRKWTGKKKKSEGEEGERPLRTYRYLTGHVHTLPLEK